MATDAHRQGRVPPPLFAQMLLFALPIMAMNMLQLLFNAADMVVVGRFAGSGALAAVGATTNLIGLIVNLFMGLSVGTNVVVAQDYGAGDLQAISRSVHTSLGISAVGGLMVMVAGLVVCKPLLALMGTPGDIIALSTVYTRIYFYGLPASMIYNFGAAILRAIGDSRRPMYYLTVTGTINVILNMFFVIVLQMGVAGVAWATVISHYLALLLMINCLSNSTAAIGFRWRLLRLDKEKARAIMQIGLPAGLQGVLFSSTHVLIQSAVNSFGSVVVAASAAAASVEGFAITAMNAYYNAALTFTGQSVGRKEYDQIDAVAKVCTICIFATWVMVNGLILCFGRTLLGFYTTNPEVIEVGMVRMKVRMAAYFICGLQEVFPGITRAMGYSLVPTLITLTSACVLRVIWLATAFRWNPTVVVLFLSFPVTWIWAAIGQVGLFFYARRRLRETAS